VGDFVVSENAVLFMHVCIHVCTEVFNLDTLIEHTGMVAYFHAATVPSLVDKENGILKIKEVLTCFPHLTEDQVTRASCTTTTLCLFGHRFVTTFRIL